MHSSYSLGEITDEKHLNSNSQAYSGGSAIDHTPTRDCVSTAGKINGSPASTAEQIQQEVGIPNEQLSPTLPWSMKPADASVPSDRNNQQPVVPTKKKERPSVKRSSRKETDMKPVQVTPVDDDQDVEMTDVAGDQLVKQASKPKKPTFSPDDPIESYGSIKQSNDDMEIDSEGVNLHNMKPKQAEQVQGVGGGKPSREAIAAIASPQKSGHDTERPCSPKNQLPATSSANNSKASRPPGITLLQHSAILIKDRERKENALAKGPDSRHCPKPGKRQAKTGHQTIKVKGVSSSSVNSLLQKAVDTPIRSHPHDIDELEQNVQEDVVIDIEQEDIAKILAEENTMKQSIHEANIKWHSNDEEEFRMQAGRYALDFLKSMNGTLCYLIVAFRMLAKCKRGCNQHLSPE